MSIIHVSRLTTIASANIAALAVVKEISRLELANCRLKTISHSITEYSAMRPPERRVSKNRPTRAVIRELRRIAVCWKIPL